jgi:hypothetical protein
MENQMSRQLVSITNTVTGSVFKGQDLKNNHLIKHAELNPETFQFNYEDIQEEASAPAYTINKLMAKSVKELHKIASENNMQFQLPPSHMTKAEIAGAIIEFMKGK